MVGGWSNVFTNADEELAEDEEEKGDAEKEGDELGAGGGVVGVGDAVPDEGGFDGANEDGSDDEVDGGLHLFKEAEAEVAGGVSRWGEGRFRCRRMCREPKRT